MRNLFLRRYSVLLLVTIASAVFTGPRLSVAKNSVTTITVVNQSDWEIRHVYLSPPDQNDWGPDQLGGSVIAPGGSSTLSNVACEQVNLKVIAEDRDGCFLYRVVACGDNTTWTIANDAVRDCGN